MNNCSCPVHRGGQPPEIPLGVSFAHRVGIESIQSHVAAEIYEAHHQYRPELPSVNLCHHGIQIDGKLTGAITYRHPLIQKMILDDRTYNGGDVVEIARICIAVDTPNLASASLTRSVEKFKQEHNDGIELIVTYIHEDYEGSMLKAVRDWGWEYWGLRETAQPSNRKHDPIHDANKHRWVLPLDREPRDDTQVELSDFDGYN